MSFTTISPTINDIDGNTYNVITVGTQIWMAENLRTTKYNNGDLIGTTLPSTLDISYETSPKYQWAPDDNESNVAVYGRLYTWYVVTDSRNICPTNWHVPTPEEFITLIDYLGGESVAGGKLKESGTTHWAIPNTGGSNETGFTALPAGNRYRGSPVFSNFGLTSNLWSSRVYISTLAYGIRMTYNSTKAEFFSLDSGYGFSVRCRRNF
jgi:uncharacterized protein (TIGR02145 family)